MASNNISIVFICGALEFGKDGVGDYTRRLSSELAKHKIDPYILAYNDGYVSQKEEQIQTCNQINIKCLRLPANNASKSNQVEAKIWLQKINPEWVSLQFVPYSFNPKGIPFGLAKSLKQIIGSTKLHIMVHELWIGMNDQASNKQKIIGKLQHVVIKSMLKTLTPKCITTQTKLYQHHINKMGLHAEILPLFSNIQMLKNRSDLDSDIKRNLTESTIAIFGSIHPQAPIEDFIQELAKIDTERRCSFIAIGRNGSELQFWSRLIQKHGFKITILGLQSEQVVSKVLSHCKWGIVTTPYTLLHKSGSAMAMLSHQLPVICFSKPWKPKGYSNNSKIKGAAHYQKGNLKTILNEIEIPNSKEIQLENIANTFIKQLKLV